MKKWKFVFVKEGKDRRVKGSQCIQELVEDRQESKYQLLSDEAFLRLDLAGTLLLLGSCSFPKRTCADDDVKKSTSTIEEKMKDDDVVLESDCT